MFSAGEMGTVPPMVNLILEKAPLVQRELEFLREACGRLATEDELKGGEPGAASSGGLITLLQQALGGGPGPDPGAGVPPSLRRDLARLLVSRGDLAPEDEERLFPSVPPIPFAAAPGSGPGSHHSHPGGLALHVAANLRLARHLMADWEHQGGGALAREAVEGAVLWHDVFKPAVFRWDAAGNLVDHEVVVAGVGSHHFFAVAHALRLTVAREGRRERESREPPFGVLVACAHIRPDDGPGLRRLLEAACLLAFPGETGAREGDVDRWVEEAPEWVETWVHFFSDGTYPFTTYWLRRAEERLRALWAGLDDEVRWRDCRGQWNWFRHQVLAQGFQLQREGGSPWPFTRGS